jgi:endothelin-converting enzyme/putative endopeptidase
VPAQNVDAFYQAFDIKKGDGMYIEPDKRVKIW